MKRLLPFWLTFLLAALLALGQPALARADEGDKPPNDDNLAVAINTKDGSSIFRFAFDITKVADGVVDNTNAAIAYSNCESCRTVAIAIQIVIVVGNASEVTPENWAIAINESCTLCETLASAYQFVIGVSEPVRFTGEGQRRIREILREMRRVGRSDLPIAEIHARIKELIAELRHVLRTQLVPVKRHPKDDDERRDDDQRAPPTTTEESPPTETDETTTEETGTTETSTGESTTTQTTGTTTTGP